MKKFRILMIVTVLITLLVPMSVMAAGTFYCSALISSGGNGTWHNPWACSTDAQLDTVIFDYICQDYGGGHLYRIFSGSYVYYRIEWVPGAQGCRITYTAEYPGYPPNTGPDLPLPLILAGVGAVGAVLLLGGLTLRRKAQAS